MTARTAVAIALAAAAPAAADVKSDDTARAAQLFAQGQAAIAASRIDDACTMFETSLRLDAQIGTRLNLADCRERQGRLAEAYALFVAGADEADRTNKPGRAKFARERGAALRARLVSVSVRVATPELPGLAIKLGGRELAHGEWATPRLVAPGAITVDATAPGYGPVHAEATGLGGGELEIAVPALLPMVTADKPRGAGKLPWIVGGTGVALVAASVAIGLHAKSRWTDATNAHDAAAVDRALTEADVATGVAIAGTVALAAGVVLYVRGRDGVAVAPMVGGGSVGLSVQLTTP